MNLKLCDTGAKNLVYAIVMKAVDDWKLARKKLKKNPESISANYSLADCENFFRSDYFVDLTGMDGTELLERIKKQEEEGRETRRKRGERKA